MTERAPEPAMVALLVCPRTRTPLRWDADRALLVSDVAGIGYLVRDGVPVLLVEAAIAV